MYERAQAIEKKSYGEKGSSPPKAQNTEFSSPISAPADRILFLQRTIGNQAVQRLFKGVGALLSAVGGQIQPKLTIGQPNDIYEQEADRVAEQVMSMPEPQLQRQEEEEEEEEEEENLIQTEPIVEQITPFVQRQVEEEEKEQENLQIKEVPGQTPEVTPDLEANIQSSRTGGTPLPESVRTFFEPRFVHDFSQVSIHTGPDAAQINRDLNAQAFTSGRNIYFGSNRYNPGSFSGNRLLAHELTHVLQQKSRIPKRVNAVPKIQLLVDCNDPRITGWSDSLERVIEAHDNAVAFALGAREQVATVLRGDTIEPCVQRQLSFHFGNPNNAQLRIIVTYYNNIVRRLNQGARAIYLCVVTGCGESSAIQRGHDRTKICPAFFDSTLGDLERAGILVEEAAHFAGVTGDHYIFMPGYPGRTPHNNGPSYGRFAQGVGGCLALWRMRAHRPRTPQPSRRATP